MNLGDMLWFAVKDGDARVTNMYRRHYSSYEYKDGRRDWWPGYRNRNLVMGPGEKMVLLASDGRAIFGWRKFRDASGQKGVNCAFFRNEGHVLSSRLILAAEQLAWMRWPGERLYTYVNTRKVGGDGACFKYAGWRKCGRTKKRRLLILEKYP